ncbi:hypothetical protein BDR07DRAFT_1497493 [Suillus spraguei]|nr:hypothetical protein BDR07DRAFT_1497493 [Suillus spraguei]
MQKVALEPIASTSTVQKATMKEDIGMKTEDVQVLNTDTMHPPTLLPDYGGLIFHHHQASLRQLDICDNADNLITPDKWYSKLHQGTLVLFAATMHGYVQKDTGQKAKKTWQLVAKSIKVIDHSNESIEPHYKSILPNTEKQGAAPLMVLTNFKIEKRVHSK